MPHSGRSSEVPQQLIAAHKKFIDVVRMSVLGRERTVWNTLELCVEVFKNKIPGALMECGVAYGGEPAVMAYAAREYKEDRLVYLVDSFCGIPVGGPRDYEDITACVGKGDGSLVSSGISSSSVADVKKRLIGWGLSLDNMRFVEGWFQHTLPTANFGPLALLRLDGDLYESTKVCLDCLYSTVSPGGYVIIDDWNLAGCREAVFEMIDKLPVNQKPVLEYTVDDVHQVCFWKKPII